MGRHSIDVNRLLLIAVLVLLALVLYRIEQLGSWAGSTRQPAITSSAEQGLAGQPSQRPVQELGKNVASPQTEADALSSSRPKYGIITLNTFETSYDHMAVSNKHKYAKMHGYDMIWDFDPNMNMWKVWDRLNVLQREIEAHVRGGNDYRWLWCVDFDTLITNKSITLESVIEDALSEVENPDDIDLIVTPDCFPLNVGSMLLRATPWSLALIKQWWKEKEVKGPEGSDRSEQDCLRDMIEANTILAGSPLGVRDKTVVIKQWKMNAFPPEIRCYDQDKRPWQRGMFLVHFAGAWAHVKDPDPVGVLMRKYYPQIV